MMKDSNIDAGWLREQMTRNPPRVLDNGNLFSGPVRLSFPNLFKPGKPSQDAGPGAEGKFGCALLFPPGTDMGVFERAWLEAARTGLPQNWAGGKPVGIHSPFHDQAEKAVGPKPLSGYTPGAMMFSATSKYKPAVVDQGMNPLHDESRVYPGVWAFCALNVYAYNNVKKGVAFGLQSVMLAADDTKLAGGGGNPTADFRHVAITGASDVAAKFAGAPTARPAGTGPAQGIMPSGGHVGSAGHLPVHALETEDERLARELMGS